MNKYIIAKSVLVDDWTAERAIVASNLNCVHVDDWTAKWAIIASNVNNVHVDDRTAELVVIASNVNRVCVDDVTAERAIIASNGPVWDEKKSKICSCDNRQIWVLHLHDYVRIIVSMLFST